MAAQTLGSLSSSTDVFLAISRSNNLLYLSSTSRRHQFARYVHTRHGVRNLYPTINFTSRVKRGFPPRGYGSHGYSSLCHSSGGDFGLEVRHVHSKYQQRESAPRPSCVFRIQVRRGHHHASHCGNPEPRRWDRRMGRLDGLRLYVSGERPVSGMWMYFFGLIFSFGSTALLF